MRERRLDSLTSLRWFAALVVFGRHLFTGTRIGALPAVDRLLPQGAVGVSFFFILSGFVLAWSRRTDDAAGQFYRRRFARIYPAYLVALAAAVVVLRLVLHGNPTLPALVTSPLLVQSWVPRSSVYYGFHSVAWSLSTEAAFYAAFPLLIASAMRLRVAARRPAMAVLVVSVVALAAVAAPAAEGTGRFWLVYIFPVTRCAEFVLGILVALEVRDGRWPARRAVGLGVAAASYVIAGWVPQSFMWVATTVAPFAFAIGAVAAADVEGRPTWLWHPALRRLGEWSYCFYLVHTLAILVVARAIDNRPMVAAASFVVAVAAAAALSELVEKPAERRLRPRGRRAELAP